MSGTVCVFDSSALLAFLKGEPGQELVRNLITDPTNARLAHALNFTDAPTRNTVPGSPLAGPRLPHEGLPTPRRP
jgi:hypothetical protein